MVLPVVTRIGRSLVVVLLVTMAVVALMSLAPGSAAQVILGENATPEAVAELNAKLGLDQPLWSQYLNWLSDAVRGDLGTSPVTSQPVTEAIIERLPVTLQLAAMALVISLVIAVLLAVASAVRPGRPLDRAINVVSSVFLSGTNHEEDAGMMKITDKGPWPFAELGTLAETRLGDWVLTLGHPGGFDPERSMVVRLGRIIRLSPGALQTDCTLSAGDSGGPLFDMLGKVIGIHSRISDSTAENFHVSITAFRDSWDRLVKGESWGDERSQRPWFGVRGVEHPDGCKLESVEEDAPAFKAGLKVGDIVRKINGHEVKDYATLRRLVAESKPGDELKVELQRGEKEMSMTVKVEARRGRR